MFYTRRLLVLSRYEYLALLFLLLASHLSCNASSNNYCTPSSCGIHNISYPFRLKTDPLICGRRDYELVCENNVTLILYLDSVKYYVQAINYSKAAIRIVDADYVQNHQTDHNCSSIPIPSHSMTMRHGGYSIGANRLYTSYLIYQNIVFVKCERAVNSLLYVENNCGCKNLTDSSSSYSYIIVSIITMADLMDSCLVESMAFTSLLLSRNHVSDNISCLSIRESMAYGLEISWFQVCCGNHCQPYGLPNYQSDCSNSMSVLLLVVKEVHLGLSWLFSHLGLSTPSNYILGLPQFLLYYLIKVPDWLRFLIELFYDVFIIPVQYRIFLFICGAPCIVAFLIYKWRRRHLSVFTTIEEFLQSENNYLMPVRYSYSNIKKMTRGFKEKLGEGGFGCVYKGKLRSGHFAAIKMLNNSNANGRDFINEVGTIGKIHHVNVVRLIGYCVEGSKRALVYEFMVNGSLDKYIFSQGGNNAISKEKIYEISLGIARGIDYLHRGCDMKILHFDIKPHNILLEEKFNPKISDFGLAKLYSTDNSIVSLTAARGTMGYMAPELLYKNIGDVSNKADVYSFGMLLMEMAGGRKNLNAHTKHYSKIYLPSWAYDQIVQGNEIELVGDTTDEARMLTKKMFIVALWCIQLRPIDRPSMHKVIEMLEGDVDSLIMPPKPSLSLQETVKEDIEIQENSTWLEDWQQNDSNTISLMIDAK